MSNGTLIKNKVMVIATWNGQLIAQSEDTVLLKNNHYFSPSDVNTEYLQNTDTQTRCPYKGYASYYDVVVNGKPNKDAAWYYPTTKEGFEKIAGRIAFWRGVKVEKN